MLSLRLNLPLLARKIDNQEPVPTRVAHLVAGIKSVVHMIQELENAAK